MRKIVALLLALLLGLGMTACRYDSEKLRQNKEKADVVENERLTQALCDKVWVSDNHRTTNTVSLGVYTDYPTLTFYENGTCVYTGKTYKGGELYSEDTYKKYWKISNGRVAVFPEVVESASDTVYYEYADGVLLGSAAYCDHPFTYTPQ